MTLLDVRDLSVRFETDDGPVHAVDRLSFTLGEGEVTTRRPPAPKHAPVAFRRLDAPTRTALLAVPTVRTGFDALTKACADSSASASGDATAVTRCDRAEGALTGAIADFVRTGHALPPPARRP